MTVSNIPAGAIGSVCSLLINGTRVPARVSLGIGPRLSKTHGIIVDPLTGRCPLVRCG